MHDVKAGDRRRNQISGYLLLGIGIGGMILSAAHDFIRPGRLDFGMTQLAGFVICTIVALSGLHKTAYPKAKAWGGALLLIYLAGILVMGLMPSIHKYPVIRKFFIVSRLPIRDFCINIAGFIPFGYLAVSYLFSAKRRASGPLLVGLAVAAGVGISLLIETAQYYIPGRTSSLYDLIANGAGTCIGVIYFMLEKRFDL
jgi:VanZ like family